ncbi:methylglyoxal synthase [Azospirillum halopraeferens]|uniref:methylglyoxal synthase n=1 Tax=Azospirillum halopraeferens TaxID=34010 RepID=UPI00042A8D0A|nr:methylglyoxal synthase [Azospirillum halopraeferens]
MEDGALNKAIGVVAHDERKADLVDWIATNIDRLRHHRLFATGTTGRAILARCPDLDVTRLKSGPLGGDQQLGAMIAEGRLDALFFFIDPMTPMPHDVDVKALTRLCTLYDLPVAYNRATADHLVTSPLFETAYERRPADVTGYLDRIVERTRPSEKTSSGNS